MLSSSNAAAVAVFDATTRDQLLAMGAIDSQDTAGAITLKTYQTTLAVSGTMAFTLADGTVAGQRKRIVCGSAASSPLGTVTIASPETTSGFACASAFTFTSVGQAIELMWTGTKWRCTRVQRSGNQAVVVGTTELAGLNLAMNYQLSVTGTVSSTGTKGLPNGSSVGERVILSNPTAASIPVGNITGTYLNILGAAATDLQAIGATTDTAVLEWTGAAWQILYSTGITVA